MVQWSKSAVRQLYKSLLKLGYTELKYTDKDFYAKTVKKEFQKYKGVTDAVEQQYHLDKGHFFLNKQKGKLL